jgi:hypothetical protein
MDLGCERLEESIMLLGPRKSTTLPPTHLSVRLRISMGSSSKVSGAASCDSASPSSSFLTKTSPSAVSSSSTTMFALRGSSISGTCGPCSVLARLRESGLLGAGSSRVNEREGWRLFGRGGVIMAGASVRLCEGCECRVPALSSWCY